MPGVPAVWETIRKGVLTKLDQATPMKRRIFDLAFHLKWIFIKLKLPTHIFDKIVFGKIKEQTGGRLKLLVSGGAPIPKETQQFLTVCVSPMVQGYGMTECVGYFNVYLMLYLVHARFSCRLIKDRSDTWDLPRPIAKSNWFHSIATMPLKAKVKSG